MPLLVQCGSLCILCYSEYLFPQMHIENGVFIILLTLTVTLDETDRLCAEHSAAVGHSALPLNFFNLYFERSPTRHQMQTPININTTI